MTKSKKKNYDEETGGFRTRDP